MVSILAKVNLYWGVHPILQMEEGRIAHFHISPLVLRQLNTTHDLNLVMFDIIKFIAPACKAILQPLSPHAKLQTKEII